MGRRLQTAKLLFWPYWVIVACIDLIIVVVVLLVGA